MRKEDIDRLAEHLTGTCREVPNALELLEIDASLEEAEEALEGRNLERCSGCDWWFDAGELIDDDGNVVGCYKCRPRSDE